MNSKEFHSYRSMIKLTVPTNISRFEVYESIAKFVQVHTIDYSRTSGYCQIFVSSSQSIEKVMPPNSIPINGIDIRYSVDPDRKYRICSIRPMAKELQQAPDQQSPHHILNILYDDVLRMVLEYCSVDLEDLTAVACTCTRFSSIAKDIYKTKANDEAFAAKKLENCQIWWMDDYFRSFGPLISTLNLGIFSREYADFALYFFTKRCKKVKTFQCKIHFHDDDLQMVQTFFRLNTLLTTVTLDRVYFPVDKILMYSPKLHTLKLSSDSRSYRIDDVACFKQMKCLKHLELHRVHVDNMKRILYALRDGDVQLERLCLDINYSMDDELFDLIRQYESVTWLKLNEISNYVLLRCIRDMGHLREFESFSCDTTISGVRLALEQPNHLTKASFLLPHCVTRDVVNHLNAIKQLKLDRGIELSVTMQNRRYYDGYLMERNEVADIVKPHDDWLHFIDYVRKES